MRSFAKPGFAIHHTHLMLIFGDEKEIQVHPLKVNKRNTKRQGSADEKQRLWRCPRARVAFITHGLLSRCFFLYAFKKKETNLEERFYDEGTCSKADFNFSENWGELYIPEFA